MYVYLHLRALGSVGVALFKGMVSRCPLLRSEFVLESHIGSWTFVRCPETKASASRRLRKYYNHAKANP